MHIRKRTRRRSVFPGRGGRRRHLRRKRILPLAFVDVLPHTLFRIHNDIPRKQTVLRQTGDRMFRSRLENRNQRAGRRNFRPAVSRYLEFFHFAVRIGVWTGENRIDICRCRNYSGRSRPVQRIHDERTRSDRNLILRIPCKNHPRVEFAGSQADSALAEVPRDLLRRKDKSGEIGGDKTGFRRNVVTELQRFIKNPRPSPCP